jgi:hypothetical protein
MVLYCVASQSHVPAVFFCSSTENSTTLVGRDWLVHYICPQLALFSVLSCLHHLDHLGGPWCPLPGDSRAQPSANSWFLSWHLNNHYDRCVRGPLAHKWARLPDSLFSQREHTLFPCHSSDHSSSELSTPKLSGHSITDSTGLNMIK